MHTSKYQATARPILKKYLRSSSPRGRSGQSCEPQPDCCGKLPKKPKRNPEEPYIERDCFPDIFKSWMPTIPKLVSNQIKTKTETQPFTKKICSAHMKGPPSIAETKQKAKECLLANAPGAVLAKPKKPEVIILSTWSPINTQRHLIVTDFAYDILCSKRPRTRRKINHCYRFHHNYHIKRK